MSDEPPTAVEEELRMATSEESALESDSEDEFEESSGGDSSDDEGPDVSGLWVPIFGEDPGPATIPFTAVPGPKHPPSRDAKPIDYLNLFFPPDFVDHVVVETNRYSQQWIDSHQDYLRQHPTSAVHQWIKKGPATPEEFRAFLGIMVNMGLIKKPTITSYWDSSHPSQNTPWFPEHFSRDRFQLYLKFLHFNDNAKLPPPDDPEYKLFKIQPLISHFSRVFHRCYHPQEDISIDESMVGFKGKTPHLRQYMPQKRHARFGIKLWCLCESKTGYTSAFEVFKGRNPADVADPRGSTHALVMRLLRSCDLLNRGHHLGVDNFFTSPDLCLELYSQGTTATGTVRAHRKGLPKAALQVRLRNQEVTERRKGPLLCVTYQDGKKKPILLSTAVAGGFVEYRNRKGRMVRKPKCVKKYNESMGGVDMSDARLYAYLAERRTMKWSLKVAFSLFGRAILNGFVIYSQNTSDSPKLSRYQFMVAVVEGLAGDFYPPKVVRQRRTAREIQEARANPQLQIPVQSGQPSSSAPSPQSGQPSTSAPSPQSGQPSTSAPSPQSAQPSTSAPSPQSAEPQPGPSGEGHELVKLPVGKKRICVAGHSSRVRSGWMCPACGVGLCPGCFASYHKKPRKF